MDPQRKDTTGRQDTPKRNDNNNRVAAATSSSPRRCAPSLPEGIFDVKRYIACHCYTTRSATENAPGSVVLAPAGRNPPTAADASALVNHWLREAFWERFGAVA
jgi:hypothetical protein